MTGERMTSSAREALARAIRRRVSSTDGVLTNQIRRDLAGAYSVSEATVRRVHAGFNPKAIDRKALNVDQKMAVARFAGSLRPAHRWLAAHGLIDVDYREFTRRFHRLDPLEQIALQKGGHVAAGRALSLKQTTERRLQRVHFDHTMLDIDVTYRNAVGRPWVSLLVDAHTRMILSATLIFGKDVGGDPNTASVVGLIAGSMIGWDHNGNRYGGIPEAVWYDNALSHLATAVTNGLMEYGIAGHAVQKASPWQNGKAEAVVDTMTREFITGLPGYIHTLPDRWGNPAGRLVDPDEMLRFQDLSWLFDKWIDVYNFERPHSAIGMAPGEMWALDSTPIEYADPDEVRHMFMSDKTRRTVRDHGVEFKGVDFINPALCDKVGHTVEVRYVPGHLDFIDCYDLEGNYLGEAVPHGKLTEGQRAKILRFREQAPARVQKYVKNSNAVARQEAADQLREAQILHGEEWDDKPDEIEDDVALWDQINGETS